MQIIPRLDAGGAERTTIDIAEGLTQSGARALVATEGGRLVGELQAKGGIWIPFPAATKNPFSMISNIGKLVRIIREEKVDIIHARSRAPAWVALAAAKLTKIKFVTTYHGSYSSSFFLKTLYNSIMARGDVVIANSEFTADEIKKTYGTMPGKLIIIPRGTDLKLFSPSNLEIGRVDRIRKIWNIPLEYRIALLAARITSWKGQKIFIEAAELLHKDGMKDVIFIIAGDSQGRDEYVRELEDMVATKNLKSAVRIFGHITDMPAALAASSIVVVPSTSPEAFGRVAVESQAMGTPVIVSDLGAARETVLSPNQVRAEQRTGWHFQSRNVTELAQNMVEALCLMPSARGMLAKRARQHVEKNFSLDTMIKDTLNVYTDMLKCE